MLLAFVISFLASLLALICSLWIEHKKRPEIEIAASEANNVDHTYQFPGPHEGERWKFFRIAVKNKTFSWPFSIFLVRQTADNCRAMLTFYKEAYANPIFTMRGRWISTPELPLLTTGHDALIKTLYPDPVTISAGEKELLDVIVKNGHGKEAYGWNNEAYFNNWMTPAYRLDPGNYLVKVAVSTQNGITIKKILKLIVAADIQGTRLDLA